MMHILKALAEMKKNKKIKFVNEKTNQSIRFCYKEPRMFLVEGPEGNFYIDKNLVCEVTKVGWVLVEKENK